MPAFSRAFILRISCSLVARSLKGVSPLPLERPSCRWTLGIKFAPPRLRGNHRFGGSTGPNARARFTCGNIRSGPCFVFEVSRRRIQVAGSHGNKVACSQPWIDPWSELRRQTLHVAKLFPKRGKVVACSIVWKTILHFVSFNPITGSPPRINFRLHLSLTNVRGSCSTCRSWTAMCRLIIP